MAKALALTAVPFPVPFSPASCLSLSLSLTFQQIPPPPPTHPSCGSKDLLDWGPVGLHCECGEGSCGQTQWVGWEGASRKWPCELSYPFYSRSNLHGIKVAHGRLGASLPVAEADIVTGGGVTTAFMPSNTNLILVGSVTLQLTEMEVHINILDA